MHPTTLAVSAVVRRIPRGKVVTYGQVAEAAGLSNPRQVSRAMGGGRDLPWWRVLGAGGVIRVPGEGALDQAVRLRMEGVEVRGKRVDLKRFGYQIRSKEASIRSEI